MGPDIYLMSGRSGGIVLGISRLRFCLGHITFCEVVSLGQIRDTHRHSHRYQGESTREPESAKLLRKGPFTERIPGIETGICSCKGDTEPAICLLKGGLDGCMGIDLLKPLPNPPPPLRPPHPPFLYLFPEPEQHPITHGHRERESATPNWMRETRVGLRRRRRRRRRRRGRRTARRRRTWSEWGNQRENIASGQGSGNRQMEAMRDKLMIQTLALRSWLLCTDPISGLRPEIAKKKGWKRDFGKMPKMGKWPFLTHFWANFPPFSPIFPPFFAHFPGGAKIHFSAIFFPFRALGPQNGVCTGQSGSQAQELTRSDWVGIKEMTAPCIAPQAPIWWSSPPSPRPSPHPSQSPSPPSKQEGGKPRSRPSKPAPGQPSQDTTGSAIFS